MRLAHICGIITLFAAIAPIANGQMTTSSLRATYGMPLSRETFVVRPGLEVVVDYAINGQVCRLQFPGSLNVRGNVPPGVITPNMLDEAVDAVVPPAMRGKELGHLTAVVGTLSSTRIEYEHVFVSELHNANKPGQREGVTVTFKDQTCADITSRPRLH